MGLAVNLSEPFNRHVRADLRRIELLLTESYHGILFAPYSTASFSGFTLLASNFLPTLPSHERVRLASLPRLF